MSKTRADLRFKALSIIVGGDVGQVPSDEDASALDGYIDSVLAELAVNSIVYIGDADDLPDEYFLSVAELVANAAGNEFGGKYDPAVQRMYENKLRVLARQTPGYGPMQAEYF